ncbi:MAG: ABC transporter substrate-binding protein [Chloroflexota bacterium]|nr:ABC transporter substrate-binding protein [Chloroflexota bacterium]
MFSKPKFTWLTCLIILSLLTACGAPSGGSGAAPSAEATQPAAEVQPGAAQGRDLKTLIVVMPDVPTNFDPGVATAGTDNLLHRAVYEGLVNYKGASITEVEPVLAESFSANDDSSVWTFIIRQNVKFTDGTTLTAQTVKDAYVRMVTLGYLGNTINRFTGGNLDNLIVKDEYTLEWHCGFACPTLPVTLATAYGTAVISPAAVKVNAKADDLAQEWLTQNAVGTGAYMISEVKPNQEIILVKNPDYWRGWADDHFEQIILRAVPEAATRRQLLEKGDADIGQIDVAEDRVALLESGDVIGSDVPLLRVNYATFTVRGVLTDPRVRQAIAYAFDYDGYADQLELGVMKRGATPWPSGMSSAQKDGFVYETDLEKAKQLLQEAGVAEGTELTFMYYKGFGGERVGQVLQAQLAQIGLALTLEERDEGAFNDVFYGAAPIEERPEMMYYAWWPDYDDFYNYVNPVFHTRNDQNDGLGNGSLYSNARIDQLTEASKTETDPAKLQAIYAETHQILTFDDPAGLWIAEPNEQMLLRADIQGHPYNPVHVKTFDFYGLSRE